MKSLKLLSLSLHTITRVHPFNAFPNSTERINVDVFPDKVDKGFLGGDERRSFGGIVHERNIFEDDEIVEFLNNAFLDAVVFADLFVEDFLYVGSKGLAGFLRVFVRVNVIIEEFESRFFGLLEYVLLLQIFDDTVEKGARTSPCCSSPA